MLKTTETRTINATSSVEQQQTDGTSQEMEIASMSATVEADGRTSVSTYVYDPDLFKKNKDTVVTDMVTFLKNAYGVED